MKHGPGCYERPGLAITLAGTWHQDRLNGVVDETKGGRTAAAIYKDGLKVSTSDDAPLEPVFKRYLCFSIIAFLVWWGGLVTFIILAVNGEVEPPVVPIVPIFLVLLWCCNLVYSRNMPSTAYMKNIKSFPQVMESMKMAVASAPQCNMVI